MPNHGAKWPALLFTLLAVCTTITAAQQAPRTAGALSVDLSRYYFKTPQEEMADRTELSAALNQLERFKGQLNSASRLLALLHQNDAVQKLFAKHDDYLYLRCSLNRKDSACEEKTNSTLSSTRRQHSSPAILVIPEDQLRSFLSQEPKLKQYSFEISDIRRNASHLLPEAQQRFLDEWQPEIADWQYDLYDKIVAGINFGTVQTPAGRWM